MAHPNYVVSVIVHREARQNGNSNTENTKISTSVHLTIEVHANIETLHQ